MHTWTLWTLTDLISTVPETLGRLTWILDRKPPVRVASRAVVLQCLSYLALHYTQSFCDYFRLDSAPLESEAGPATDIYQSSGGEDKSFDSYAGQQHSMRELLHLASFSDPLIRGSLAHIITCFISGFLCNQHTVALGSALAENAPASTRIDVPGLITHFLLKLLLDESANVRKMVCQALTTCFNNLLASPYAQSAIIILYTLLDSIREDTYWLVKTEV